MVGPRISLLAPNSKNMSMARHEHHAASGSRRWKSDGQHIERLEVVGPHHEAPALSTEAFSSLASPKVSAPNFCGPNLQWTSTYCSLTIIEWLIFFCLPSILMTASLLAKFIPSLV